MYECKICGKNLYNNITFYNMFRTNLVVHNECIKNLNFNHEDESIPIESNIIIYDYVFKQIRDDYNEEYLWCNYFCEVIKKHIYNKYWSMLIIYDESVTNFLSNENPYLLVNLSNKPILLISLIEKDVSYLERL